MFKFILLCPHQMWNMNDLCVKIDLTEVVHSGNTRSKVKDLVFHLLPLSFFFFFFLFFKKWLILSIYKYINLKIKNACVTKFIKSYKISLQSVKYDLQFAKCEVRICSLKLIITRNAEHCNNHNDLTNLSFILKNSVFSEAYFWEEWPSGLRHCNQNWKVPSSIPARHWLGLETQLCYEAPDDLQVNYVKMQWLTLGKWGCPLDNDPELAVGQPNSS